MLKIKIILIVAFFIHANLAWKFNNPYEQYSTGSSDQIVQFFDQILDHYSYLPPTFWKQKYYVKNTYFEPHQGPIILILGGQGPCTGISQTSYIATIAKQTKALMIQIQHRYYGDSLPIRNNPFATNNLKYLSSKQALKDIAYFIQQIKRNKWYGISSINKWITVGGSYSGALSAWFRSKYPHLTVGAIASSAVINAVQDFRDFDEQIFLSANLSGSYCVDAIKKVTQFAQQQSLSSNRLAFQGQFGAQKLTTRQFMFYWSDVIVFQIQYGRRNQFCASLKNKTIEQLLKIVKPLVKAVSPVDYGAYYLSSQDFALADGRGARSWYYQCCTEFSYFQTFSHNHPMRSKLLTIDFYRKWCEDIYGNNTWPDVDRTNNEFGGLKLQATNLIITNGFQDPWKWASLQSNSNKIISKIAKCTDCAHCADLHTPKKTDDKQLVAIRQYQLSQIKLWLSIK